VTAREPPLLFALNAGRELGLAVARALGVELAAHEEREFEDGEHKARSLVGVQGRSVYVVHSLHGEPGASSNDKLVRLLFFLGSLHDAGAGRVTAVVPYLAYARKDQRSKPRDPVTTRYVASFFEAVGTACLVTVDVHNLAAFENAHRCRTVNLEAADALVERAVALVGDAPAAVVSPDAGGIKRADRFRQRLSAALGRPVGAAFVEKYRSEGRLRGGELAGDVEGSVAIIVDDLVSAGHTLDRSARACAARGATRVLAAATHGVFAGPASEVLAASPIERILVTDTIPARPAVDAALGARLERVSIAPLLAEAITRLHSGD
jgi:ribose-phosphate pyrophosphokinase